MYKTVRKGDASLQYTILPQTDQFSSSGLPQSSGKPRPRIVKYTMAVLMILIILSCVATPFLMNQNDHNLFASTVLAMGRVGHGSGLRNSTRTKDVAVNKGRNRSNVVVLSTEDTRRMDLEDEATEDESILLKEQQEDEELTSPEAPSTPTQRPQVPTEVPTSARPTYPTSSQPTTSWTTVRPAVGPTDGGRATTNSSRKGKMARVTLKLRENETIPQMYMKAGIASYKKGNITTSVLAHDLSLEGLIFKTPEGTIKPWPQKWFFTDPASDFQWKGPNQMPVAIYVVLAGLAALASVSIVLMFYVQRRASRRQRRASVGPEAGAHEDKSTLLGADGQEAEEKE